jgi:hypothetical protein
MAEQTSMRDHLVTGQSDYVTPPPTFREQQLGNPVAPRNPNQIKLITIQQLSYGYVVNVGCQSFAIQNATDLISKLAEYISNPLKTEEKWERGQLFS